jgi:hypothetical protein
MTFQTHFSSTSQPPHSPSNAPSMRPLNAFHEAAAGGFSAAISRAIIAPLDVLKIRFQVQEHPITKQKQQQLRSQPPISAQSATINNASSSSIPPSASATSASSGATLRSAPGAVSAHATTTPQASSLPHCAAQTHLPRSPAPHLMPQYTSLRQAVMLILRDEGIRSFWKGNLSAQLMVVPYGAVSFAAYKWSKHHIDALHLFDRWPHLKPYERPINHLLSGSFTGAASTLCTYPLDLLRTRFACQREFSNV